MQKVLTGSSRESLGFIASHWRSLSKISAIPMLFYAVSAVLQLKVMSALYRSMGGMMANNKIDPAFMAAYFRNMGLTMLAGLLGGILMATMFVQIIRFQKSGEAQWILSDKAGWMAALMTILYAIGFMMLTMLAYLAGAFSLSILGAILGGIFVAAGANVLAILVAVVFVCALLAFLYWFMFRFWVGLPGVALGHSPDFFKDIWPLSKGETWGLPLRMGLASLIVYVPVVLLMLVFIFGFSSDLLNTLTFEPNADPAAIYPKLADVMDRMIPMQIILMVIFMPFIWFASLLLGTAFQRFRAKLPQTVKK
jgi:hypothetical protein